MGNDMHIDEITGTWLILVRLLLVTSHVKYWGMSPQFTSSRNLQHHPSWNTSGLFPIDKYESQVKSILTCYKLDIDSNKIYQVCAPPLFVIA